MKEQVKLIRLEEGYKPETAMNWEGYVPTLLNHILHHDLYEHQQEELGTGLEELRALGGRFYFDSTVLNKNQITLNYERVLRQIPESYLTAESKGISVEFEIWDFVYKRWKLENPVFFSEVIQEGYNYSKQFSKDSHIRFRSLNFFSLHKQRVNLVVDLNSGTRVA